MPERLTPTDMLWLHLEAPSSPMHAAAIQIVDGMHYGMEELLEELAVSLEVLPRFRKKIVPVPFRLHRPVWVDDEHFDPSHHIRFISLPPPGTEQQFLELAAEIAATPLDRTKPLWEEWLVHGLGENRYGIILKMHHCVIDGQGAVRAAEEVIARLAAGATEQWSPEPTPTKARLIGSALSERVQQVTRLARRGPESAGALPGGNVTEPAVAKPRIQWSSILRGAADLLRPAPKTPLNVPIGPHRRVGYFRGRVSEAKDVRTAFGGTVNDVVLTAVAGGVRAWMQQRGLEPRRELKVSMPVSTRDEGDPVAGNALSALVVPLGTEEPDPVTRLQRIARSTREAKTGPQAEVTNLIVSLLNAAPILVGRVGRALMKNQRQFNLSVSNVANAPPPPEPRTLSMAVTMPILQGNMALAAVAGSADDDLWFSFVGDHDAVPDLQVIVDGAEATFRALVAAARNGGASGAAIAQRPADPALSRHDRDAAP